MAAVINSICRFLGPQFGIVAAAPIRPKGETLAECAVCVDDFQRGRASVKVYSRCRPHAAKKLIVTAVRERKLVVLKCCI